MKNCKESSRRRDEADSFFKCLSASSRRRLRFMTASWLGASCLLLVSSMPLCAQNPDGRLEEFFKTYLDGHFQQQPMEATRMGDHRFDAQLEDLMPESRAKWLDLTKKTLKELPREVPYSKLSRDGQIDFEILQQTLKADEWLTENTHP